MPRLIIDIPVVVEIQSEHGFERFMGKRIPREIRRRRRENAHELRPVHPEKTRCNQRDNNDNGCSYEHSHYTTPAGFIHQGQSTPEDCTDKDRHPAAIITKSGCAEQQVLLAQENVGDEDSERSMPGRVAQIRM